MAQVRGLPLSAIYESAVQEFMAIPEPGLIMHNMFLYSIVHS